MSTPAIKTITTTITVHCGPATKNRKYKIFEFSFENNESESQDSNELRASNQINNSIYN